MIGRLRTRYIADLMISIYQIPSLVACHVKRDVLVVREQLVTSWKGKVRA